jgi:hypothetical protein
MVDTPDPYREIREEEIEIEFVWSSCIIKKMKKMQVKIWQNIKYVDFGWQIYHNPYHILLFLTFLHYEFQ